MKRVFYPSKPDKTTVDHWTWTKGHGLTVTYKDGLKCKSDWTLKELLTANHLSGDGLPIKLGSPTGRTNAFRIPNTQQIKPATTNNKEEKS